MYFGERGAYDFKGYGVMDFAATYNLAVWRTLRPWFKVEVFNAFNNQKHDRVGQDGVGERGERGGRQRHPTDFTQGPRYGQATAGTHFPTPYPNQTGGRAFRIAFGTRF